MGRFAWAPVFLLTLCCLSVSGQNYAVYNSYYLNPALYNPAEVSTEYTYVFVNHRQQWMNIEGAPVLTTVNFNTMLNESRTGIGAKFSSFKRGILNTNDFTLTYGYRVPFNEKNTMFLGLSAGAISNSIDLTEADGNDPAIANYLANNIQPIANFGVLFRSESGLNFGIALPQLFAPKFNSAASFENTTVTPIDNIIVSTYFRRKVEGKIVTKKVRGVRRRVKTDDAYAPLEFYALYKYSAIGDNQFEVMGKLNLSQNFWLGASYRQSYGFAGSLGFAINRFLLAYSYEPSNQPEAEFSLGTHEVQIGLRLGEAKKYKHVVPVLRSTIQTQTQRHSARFQHTEEAGQPLTQEKSKKKFYVVIRSFGEFTAADAYRKKLVDEKYNANVFYNDADRKYHVYVFETYKSSEAYEEARNLKNFTKLKDARVLTITEK